jgi:hypothetical protein
MPKDQDSALGSVINNWPALTAIVVAAIGLAIAQTRLSSPRPIDTASKPLTSGKLDRTLPARLWQDPLSVIPLSDLELKPNENEIDNLFDAIPGPLGKNPPVLFILAYVDPLTTPNASEDRRRERYAALSALNTAGYVPASPDKLTWLALAPTSVLNDSAQARARARADVAKQGTKDTLVIPYEWFRPRPIDAKIQSEDNKPKYQAICILWVNESLNQSLRLRWLAGLPAYITDRLNQWIKPPVNDNPEETPTKPKAKPNLTPTFVIAGRISSGVFHELSQLDQPTLEGQKKRFEDMAKNHSTKNLAPTCELYLTQSTVDSVRKEWDNLIRKAWNKNTPWMRPRYVIGTDDDLAGRLVEELKNRNIWPGQDGSDIAIISEWDTEYGQAMAPTFLRAASGDSNPIEPGAYRYATRAAIEKQHFYSYTYLRGLDGKVPDDKSQSGAADKSTTASSPPNGSDENKPTADKGEGNNQLDYLRRLVARMATEGKKFRAIGLLGSDVYDKLVLLQALRPSFPDAVFFTTDLDARLLQPGDFSYTHNLLVASHYGLMLDSELQCDNPPFRSGYDASSYLGYLLAAGFRPPPTGKPHLYEEWIKWQTGEQGDQPDLKYRNPHIYEIGRSGAYDLTINAEDIFHPQSPRRSPWLTEEHHLLLVSLGLAILLMLLLTISSTWRAFLRFPVTEIRKTWQSVARLRRSSQRAKTFEHDSQDMIRFGCWMALLLTLALCVAIFRSHTDPEGEPMEWLEGISVWPTELLRWAASLLSLLFIAEAFRKLQKRNQGITTDYHFKASSADARLSWPGRLRQELYAPFAMWFYWLPRNPRLQKEWDNFRHYSTGWRRLLRCILIGLLYGMLFWLLDLLFEHRVYEARGYSARLADRFLRTFSGMCQVGLLVFVVDCAVLSYRFVRYLSSDHILIWPTGLLRSKAQSRGLALTQADEAVKKGLRQLLNLELIDDVTRVVAGLIYKPFIILLILLVAQSSLFENWHWNTPLVLTVLISAATAFACAMTLQQAASSARLKALKKLDVLLSTCGGSAEGDERAKLEPMRSAIDDMQSGAFASFYQNPAIRAVLIPLGGGGGLAALEALVGHLS